MFRLIVFILLSTIINCGLLFAKKPVPVSGDSIRNWVPFALLGNSGGIVNIQLVKTFESLEEGKTTTFSIFLDNSPGQDVSVNISPSEPIVLFNNQEKLDLSFNSFNYRTPQIIQIHAIEDLNKIDEDINVQLSCDVCNSLSFPLKILDNDKQRIVIFENPEAIFEGNSKTFSVKLNIKPNSSYTVSLLSSDESSLTLSPSELNFNSSNYDTYQKVNLTAIEEVEL